MTLAIIGLGNVLLGDDGFGPFVIELLRTRYRFPRDVQLLDLGTPGLGLVSYLHGHDAVVIVDVVAGGATPGDVRVYEGDELQKMGGGPRVSPHDPAVAEALSIARAAGNGALQACVVATAPSASELGAALSEPARAAAEAAVDIIRRRVESYGFDVHQRATVAVEAEWWCAPCR